MQDHRPLIGTPVERVEDLRLLRGRGCFVGDVMRERMVHAVMFRSAVAHGVIRRLDVAGAKAKTGVLAVITAADLGRPIPRLPLRLWSMPHLVPYEQPVLADGKVRYVGEPLAVVLAETQSLAEDALASIEAEIEPLPAVTDARLAGADSVLLSETSGSNCAVTYTAALGNAAQEFADCYVRRERFRTNRHTAIPMETRGLLAEWDSSSQRLVVTGAAKVPFTTRALLAKLIKLPVESIDMIEVDVGGGFGVRGEFYPEDFLIPFAARLIGRPVKWIEDFREHLMAANHSRDIDGDVEIVCARDGRVLALRGLIFADVGAYLRSTANVGPRNVGQFMSGPYRIPNIHIEVALTVTNKTPSGTYRGPGRFEADFIRERLFDLAANDLGIDRIEFRRRNLVLSHEMPFSLASIQPFNRAEELDSGDNIETLERCLEQFNWRERSRRRGLQEDGLYWGVGAGCFVEAGASGPRERCRIEVRPDGAIHVFVGAALVGQGVETVMTQIAADALGIPMDLIRVFHGSTIYLPEGYGASHSRGTVMAGSAIVAAAANLKKTLRAAASLRLNCAEDEVTLVDALAHGPSGAQIAWARLAEPVLRAEGTFEFTKHTMAHGAQAVQVAVDIRTGEVRIVDYVCTQDVGRIVNPLTMRGQLIGAMVQGLGGALLEHMIYDGDGQLLVGTLADYLMPSASDFPVLRAYPSGNHPSPNNPLGTKGAGEGGLIATAGVIANAIAHALADFNVKCCELPFAPPRIWQMIRAGRD